MNDNLLSFSTQSRLALWLPEVFSSVGVQISQESEIQSAIPHFLTADRIFLKLCELGFIDKAGYIQDSKFIDRSLPSFKDIQNIQLKAYLDQKLDLQGSSHLSLLDVINIIVMEAKNLQIEIEDLIFNGWGAWNLLEKWEYVADVLANLDKRIVDEAKDLFDHNSFNPLEIIVYIKQSDSLALLKNGLCYEFKKNENDLNISSILHRPGYLSIPLKIKEGEHLLLRVIPQKTAENYIFPIAFSAKHILYPNVFHSKILSWDEKYWQTVISCAIRSADVHRCPYNIQDKGMLVIRNLTYGCLPIDLKIENIKFEILRYFDDLGFSNGINTMMQLSFENQMPREINELYAIAFQLSCITKNDEEGAYVWKAAHKFREKLPIHFPNQDLQILSIVADLVIQDGVPFSLIRTIFSLMGYIHQHTEDSNYKESLPINFRLSRRGTCFGIRISFISESKKRFYIFLNSFSPFLPSCYKLILNLEEDVQKKLLFLCSRLLPLNPIEQINNLPALSWSQISYNDSNSAQDAYTMLEMKHPLIQYFGLCLLCVSAAQKKQFTFFPVLLEYLPSILKNSFPSLFHIFILQTLDQLLLKYYSVEKCLENRILNNEAGLVRNHFLTLIEVFLEIKDPQILVQLKNQWSKEFIQLKEWDEEIISSGIQLLENLLHASLIPEAIGILDSLNKKRGLERTQQMALLLKICHYAKNNPDSIEMSVCYSHIGLQAKLILKDSLHSNEFFQTKLPQTFLWIIQKLLVLSQISLVAEILASMEKKSISIENKTVQDILTEWKANPAYLKYFNSLSPQFELLRDNSVGKATVEKIENSLWKQKLEAYESAFHKIDYLNCFNILISSKQFFPLEEFTHFQIKAEQLLTLLFKNKNLKKSLYKKSLELLKTYTIADGQIWFYALQRALSLTRVIKQEVFGLWKGAESNNNIIYARKRYKKCWQIVFRFIYDLSTNDVLDLFNQRDRIEQFFNNKYAHLILLKKTISILCEELPKNHSNSVMHSLVNARNTFPISIKFCKEIDLPLLSLLMANNEFQFQLTIVNILDENVNSFSDPILYPDFAIFFLKLLSNYKIEENNETNLKLITLASTVRKKLQGHLKYFTCAEHLFKIPTNEALSESVKMTLEGLNSSLADIKPPQIVYSILNHGIDKLLNIEPELIISCLTHPNISFLSDEAISLLWSKVLSTLLKEHLQDNKFSSEKYICICQYSLENIQKVVPQKNLFFNCFTLIIQINLRFLQNYQDFDTFEQIQNESLAALSFPETLQQFDLKFQGICFVITECLQAINDMVQSTQNIDRLYLFCYNILKNLDFPSESSALQMLKTPLRLFCQVSPNKNLYTLHLPFILSLCNKTLNLTPTLSIELVPLVFGKFFEFVNQFPEELATVKQCYEEIKNIINSLLIKNILPNKIFEELLLKVVLSMPFPFEKSLVFIEGEISIYTTDSQSLKNSQEIKWFEKAVLVAFEKRIINSSSKQTFNLYLINMIEIKKVTLLSLFNKFIASPSYYSFVQMIQILKKQQPYLSIQNYKKYFEMILTTIQKLPKDLNVISPLLHIFCSALSLAVQIPKSKEYPSILPLFSILIKRMIELCIQTANKNSAFMQDIILVILCLESLCKKGFYDENWGSLRDLLDFIRSNLISHSITLTPIVNLLFHLDNPGEQSEVIKFLKECFQAEIDMCKSSGINLDLQIFENLLEKLK
jgi:hypothetical protein